MTVLRNPGILIKSDIAFKMEKHYPKIDLPFPRFLLNWIDRIPLPRYSKSAIGFNRLHRYDPCGAKIRFAFPSAPGGRMNGGGVLVVVSVVIVVEVSVMLLLDREELVDLNGVDTTDDDPDMLDDTFGERVDVIFE